MKKKLVSLLLALVTCVSLCGSTYAVGFTYDENAQAFIGEVMPFTSIDTSPMDGNNFTAAWYGTPRYGRGDLIYKEDSGGTFAPGTSTKYAYFISERFVEKKFVKYLTSSWAMSNGYTWSKSNSTSISATGNVTLSFSKKIATALGLSISRTTSYSVAINIPADASRNSKLGFASDFTELTYNYVYVHGGTTDPGIVETVNCPEEDTYLVVYYK